MHVFRNMIDIFKPCYSVRPVRNWVISHHLRKLLLLLSIAFRDFTHLFNAEILEDRAF